MGHCLEVGYWFKSAIRERNTHTHTLPPPPKTQISCLVFYIRELGLLFDWMKQLRVLGDRGE